MLLLGKVYGVTPVFTAKSASQKLMPLQEEVYGKTVRRMAEAYRAMQYDRVLSAWVMSLAAAHEDGGGRREKNEHGSI